MAHEPLFQMPMRIHHLQDTMMLTHEPELLLSDVMAFEKLRFRCCQRSRQLHYSPEKAGLIINECTVLQNKCIHCNMRHFPIKELEEDWGPIPKDNGTNSLRDNTVTLQNSLLMTRF
ncbi:hypothetical protein AVEN_104801-1 [Araneus ventricosus]|uniref:Uncharacterized protein n=1 Tax=Araneus ventricosus TaxID=182803 RepID=A0A4Y2S618_ARAVE|nr:hypothetical protein AVEN_108412-1 [Araneus ventricosus]GBN83794.1 hypothetical protein AVEN_104801-1 [Araneus ventricosus]